MDVRSPITGSINLKYFDDGDDVKTKDEILSVEVFKMLWAVYSPCSGKIYYKCSLGQIVAEGEIIAHIISG